MLGLTWASVLMMVVVFAMWAFVCLKVRKGTSERAIKHEQYVQG